MATSIVESPDGLGVRTLLDRATYITRLDACQGSMQRSLLVLVALVAFWLAIENSYMKFNDYRRADRNYGDAERALAKADRDRTRTIAALQTKAGQALESARTAEGVLAQAADSPARVLDQTAQPPASSEPIADGARAPTADAPAPATGKAGAVLGRDDRATLASVERAVSEAADQERAFREKRDQIGREPVVLKIAGTDLPSQLRFAPLLWLVVLATWLAYFDAKRATAHRNLAAAHLTGPADAATFGAAGDGSAWIAPLPRALGVSVQSGEPIRVERADLMRLLAWAPRTERRYIIYLGALAALLAAGCLRIGWIAIRMMSDFATSSGFSYQGWRMPGALLTVVLITACIILLVRLPTRTSSPETSLGGRRDMIVGALALAGAGALTLFGSGRLVRFPSARDPQPGASPSVSSGNPRVRRDKERHRANRRTALRPTPASGVAFSPGALLVNDRARAALPLRAQRRVVHAVGRDGLVRLRTKAERLTHVVEISPDELVAMVTPGRTKGGGRGASRVPATRLHPARTTQIETAALLKLRDDNVADACKLLLAGARLTMQSGAEARPNYRLLDLLAGLSVRYRRGSPYLPLLIAMANGVIAIEELTGDPKKPSERSTRLRRAVTKWQASEKWRARWEDRKKPVLWHYPEDGIIEPSGRSNPGTKDNGKRRGGMRQHALNIA